MKVLVLTFVFSITLTNAHITSWKNPNQLQPVHSLYIKPSSDGSSGDLYVAASEDNGVKSQWLTEQPVNFLPGQPVKPYAFPMAHEEQNPQKRSVINQQVQYAYAYPSTEGVPYPYTVPTTTPTEGTTQHCDPKSPYQYSPYQYFYPHLMSAYANAKSVLKDSGISEETAGSILSHASPMWSHNYGYPMYVMVDPNAWNQSQQAVQTTPAPTPASTPAPTTTTEVKNESS